MVDYRKLIRGVVQLFFRLRLVWYRFSSRVRGKKIVHFLHIGKTGGSSIKYALGGGRTYSTKDYLIILHKHWFKMDGVLPGEKLFFFVRDPITRFVSGFYSRKRKGMPKTYDEWSESEKRAFNKFTNANSLAESISTREGVKAMNSIAHVRDSYWDWFKSKEYFLSRVDDILFVGSQENLNQDFEKLKKVLGLPASLELPQDKVNMHKNPDPDTDKRLSLQANRNLREWYSRDYDFLQLLKDEELIQ